MKVVITIIVAVLAQMILARYMLVGHWVFDLVLVGSVYAALCWGPVAGMLTGTVGGIIQDSLSDGIIGVGGLSKTLVAFGAGVLGSQFVVARPPGRTLFVAGATIVHRVMMVGISALIDQQWSGLPWAALLQETGINALFGFVAFQVTESGPGAIARGRANRRPKLSRRQW